MRAVRKATELIEFRGIAQGGRPRVDSKVDFVHRRSSSSLRGVRGAWSTRFDARGLPKGDLVA